MNTKTIAMSLLIAASVSLLTGCGKQAEQTKNVNSVYEQLPKDNKSIKAPDKKQTVESIYDQLPKNNKSIK
ncbi:hypothetical protein ACFFKC_22210 [Pseudoduganella danionis]|uniref:Lipoprotein n=1 Tax=Pseudoduganella danionis TaxID=1890295 RepID=A0ABW9STK9_9BURK|nr:hypothetical protein [Pseudoduganella danionis]MTW35521.1 hypothetical protein [Pseudoduganella danionis]